MLSFLRGQGTGDAYRPSNASASFNATFLVFQHLEYRRPSSIHQCLDQRLAALRAAGHKHKIPALPFGVGIIGGHGTRNGLARYGDEMQVEKRAFVWYQLNASPGLRTHPPNWIVFLQPLLAPRASEKQVPLPLIAPFPSRWLRSLFCCHFTSCHLQGSLSMHTGPQGCPHACGENPKSAIQNPKSIRPTPTRARNTPVGAIPCGCQQSTPTHMAEPCRLERGRPLLLLKPELLELQRARVLGHRAHDLIRRPAGDLGLDFHRHCDLGAG